MLNNGRKGAGNRKTVERERLFIQRYVCCVCVCREQMWAQTHSQTADEGRNGGGHVGARLLIGSLALSGRVIAVHTTSYTDKLQLKTTAIREIWWNNSHPPISTILSNND